MSNDQSERGLYQRLQEMAAALTTMEDNHFVRGAFPKCLKILRENITALENASRRVAERSVEDDVAELVKQEHTG